MNVRKLSPENQRTFEMIASDKDVLDILRRTGDELTDSDLRKLQNVLIKKFAIKRKAELESLMKDLHYAVGSPV